MAEGAKFFLISPDFELKRLAEFSPDRQDKIFSFSFYSLLDSSSKKYKDLARRLNLCYFRDGEEQCQLDPELVLLHDGLLVVSEAARLLRHDRVFLAPDQVSCTREQAWPDGSSFYNFINLVSVRGITGDIRLSGGRRTSLDLQIRHWDSARKSASQIGTWSPQLGINITSSNTLEVNHKGIPNLMVVTIQEPPYVMLKCPECSGNDRYEGFA